MIRNMTICLTDTLYAGIAIYNIVHAMETLIWKPKTLHFKNHILDAWVARFISSDVLENERKLVQSALPIDTTLVHYVRPSLFQELWKVKGLGSFDSIRFAKTFFHAPNDKYFIEGADSLEVIIDMVAEGFAEGDFKLVYASEAELVFEGL